MNNLKKFNISLKKYGFLNTFLKVFKYLFRDQFLQISAKKNGLDFKIKSDFFDVTRGDQVIRLSLRHKVYASDIINSFDYYFNAVDPIIFNGVTLVDYSTPRYHKVSGFKLMPILFPSLAEPIVTTEQYLEFSDIRNGSVVLDLGAYSGLTSIMFKEIAGKEGRVIAIEADSKNLKTMLSNYELYESITSNKIEVIEGAIWNHCDGVEFSAESNMGSSASEIVGQRGEVTMVQSYTFHALAEKLNLDRVDFIKCDIEGAEAVIFNDDLFFNRFRPRIIIEPHIVDGVETTERCIASLLNYGYKCNVIEQFGVSLPLIECYPQNN
jgi:FkbM family methyltransferase